MIYDSITLEPPDEPWWELYREFFPGSLIDYVAAEHHATTVQAFHGSVFPLPLQPLAYLRAVLECYRGEFSDVEIERAVGFRIKRQQGFYRPGRTITFLIDATVPAREIGSAKITQAAFNAAQRVHASGRAKVLKVPGLYTGECTSFSIFTLDGKTVVFESDEEKLWEVTDDERKKKLIDRFKKFEEELARALTERL
ncbi:Scr1 family TA system antitoxin-like transcriptional regulator [Amycolatopsis sp. NEAU-NG30]|uniref:Scr1 family TA system antitoxin-like transcriptional regulator n=1 Tax=Amycolatopsis melonis TaxID=3156488 RepID=A0ABV0LFM1_9PSEU